MWGDESDSDVDDPWESDEEINTHGENTSDVSSEESFNEHQAFLLADELKYQCSVDELIEARSRASICKTYESIIVPFNRGSPLSNYLNDTSEVHYQDGYLGESKYVVPLHLLSVVPGHRIERIAVHKTESTMRELRVVVSSLFNNIPTKVLRGSKRIPKYINTIVSAMDENQFAPSCFDFKVETSIEDKTMIAPLTVGNKYSVDMLSSLCLSIDYLDSTYTVSTMCRTKNYPRPCGFGASIATNNVVLMHPDVPQYMVSSDVRKQANNYPGFLCCCSAQSSASTKGTIKYLVSGTVIRCYNRGVKSHLKAMSDMFMSRNCSCKNGTVNIKLAGVEFLICSYCFDQFLDDYKYRSERTPHHVTIDENNVLSFCTGTIMRYDTVNGKWVDSNSKAAPVQDYNLGVSTGALYIPFIDCINSTRAGLVLNYLQQSIGNPGCTYDPKRTIVPLYHNQLLINPRSPLGQEMQTTNVPGLNLLAVFCDTWYTYEDGIGMSASAASRFKYFCRTRLSVSTNTSLPRIGSYIQPFQYPWWQVAFEAKVVNIEISRSDAITIIMEYIGFPVNGDKFTTLHGQKGVVTILADSEMPHILNENTNKYSPAEIVIGSSAIMHRGTPSQLLEAAAGMFIVKNNIEPGIYSDLEILERYALEKFPGRVIKEHDIRRRLLQEHESDVYFNYGTDSNGSSLYTPIGRKNYSVNSSIYSSSNVRANFGIIRVQQSVFMASVKMSCTQVVSRKHNYKPVAPKGGGGSKGMGELDLMQLDAAGMKSCLEEFSNRADMCIVEVCGCCMCMKIMCDCSDEEVDKCKSFKASLPLSAIRTMISLRVCCNKKTVLRPDFTK